MKRAFLILIPSILIFVGLSIRQYFSLYKKQKQETSDFIYKQIILCGKNIEEACLNFEESVKFEFANRELNYFFNPKPENLPVDLRLIYVDGEIKRIRRFYSRNQELISKITIYNHEYYRTFERDENNYFKVGNSLKFDTIPTLYTRTVTLNEPNSLSYIQPVSNTEGVIVANIRFDFNVPGFISSHFDQFYIGKNSLYWAINPKGAIIYHKFSETLITDHFRCDELELFKTHLDSKLSFTLQHKIETDQNFNAYSVFYPVNIFGRLTGIVFSINTDTLWKFQTQTNISILIFFVVVIISIIILFSVIITNMIQARRRLESTDVLLRAANYASEALLTEPDFEISIRSFLEITARTLGYHRAFIHVSTESMHGVRFVPRHEWFDSSFLKPLVELNPANEKGFNPEFFSTLLEKLKKKEIVKLNENEYEKSYHQILTTLNFKALLVMPIYLEEHLFGIVGFADCIQTRNWQGYEDAIFINIAHAVEGALAIQNKQTELIKAKDIAERANKLKSEFLANVSHEIRTPMNAILGFSEVMLNTSRDTKQKNYLKTILESGRMLLSLINDILDLSKIEAGRIELQPEPTDIRTITEDLRQLFRQKVSEKNLDFFIEIDPDFPRTVFIDEVRLRQILLNLIGNAVKFTEKGNVLITVKILTITDEMVDFEISVIDTGIGISESDYERIFDAFSQQSGQDTRKYGGTGLGLAISKRLCELMHGKIGLESKQDHGSRFYLTFNDIRYSDERIEQETGYYWDDQEIIFKGSTILIVDDLEPNRKLAFTYLESFDIQILEAESGQEALEKVKAVKPDLILMDIRMPGMNGYETTQFLRDIEETKNIPVIALTASTRHQEIEYRKGLFNGFIQKPFQKKLLINEMMKFLPYESKAGLAKNIEGVEDHKDIQITPVIISQDVKQEFSALFLNELNNQMGILRIDELCELLDKIVRFATHHEIRPLIRVYDELQLSIDNFDFEDIQKGLHKIKTLMN